MKMNSLFAYMSVIPAWVGMSLDLYELNNERLIFHLAKHAVSVEGVFAKVNF